MSNSPNASTPMCPVCSGVGSPHFSVSRYRFFQCGKCFTSFVFPLPSGEELREYYDKFHMADDAGGNYDWIEERMKRGFPGRVKLVLAKTNNKPGRLLDFGCGKGFFLDACKKAGIDCHGVDLSESGVQYAVNQLGLSATPGDLHDLKPQLGKFDTVCSWATAEHLPDPMLVFRDLYEVLNPGGTIFVTTCSGNDIVERLLPGVTQWYDPPQHLTIFSREGIAQALTTTGFKVSYVDMNYEYSAGRKVARWIRNVGLAASLRMSSTLFRMPQRANGFFNTRFPIGMDLVAVAKKPM